MPKRALPAMLAVLLLAACQSGRRHQPVSHPEHPAISSPDRLATNDPIVYILYLVRPGNLLAPSVVAVDIRNGAVRTRPLPQLAGGDYPYQLVRVGKELAFACSGPATCTVNLSLQGPIHKLGDSWFFVPAP